MLSLSTLLHLLLIDLSKLAFATVIICTNPESPNARSRFGSPQAQDCTAAQHAIFTEGQEAGYDRLIRWTPPRSSQNSSDDPGPSSTGDEDGNAGNRNVADYGEYRGPFQNSSGQDLVTTGQGVYRGAYLGMEPPESSSDEAEAAMACGKTWAACTFRHTLPL